MRLGGRAGRSTLFVALLALGLACGSSTALPDGGHGPSGTGGAAATPATSTDGAAGPNDTSAGGASDGGSNADAGASTDTGEPTGGVGGAGGSSTIAGGTGGTGSAARFVLLGALDPVDPMPRQDRTYAVDLVGASGDGSVLAGYSRFYDSTLDAPNGVRFFWSAESGVVKLPSGSPDSGLHAPSILSAGGTSLFGSVFRMEVIDGGRWFHRYSFYRWTKDRGDALFGPEPELYDGQLDFVSADGTTALGLSEEIGTGTVRPFRWRQGGRFEYLSSLGWPADGDYTAVSEGLNVIAGVRKSGDSGFIWFEPDRFFELGLPGFPSCSAATLSRDGTTAFGACYDVISPKPPMPKAFRWTAQTGIVAMDGPAYTETTRDGRIAMGSDWDALYRWTAESGEVKWEPSADRISTAQYRLEMAKGSLSEDGSSVYGALLLREANSDPSGGRSFRWSESEGFVQLEALAGHHLSFISAGARDGSVQVGLSGIRGGVRDAVLWDCQGVRDVARELTEAGIDLQGVHLTMASHVWAGPALMIAGSGLAAGGGGRAWIAWLSRRC
jgi:hypothetical protein